MSASLAESPLLVFYTLVHEEYEDAAAEDTADADAEAAGDEREGVELVRPDFDVAARGRDRRRGRHRRLRAVRGRGGGHGSRRLFVRRWR